MRRSPCEGCLLGNRRISSRLFSARPARPGHAPLAADQPGAGNARQAGGGGHRNAFLRGRHADSGRIECFAAPHRAPLILPRWHGHRRWLAFHSACSGVMQPRSRSPMVTGGPVPPHVMAKALHGTTAAGSAHRRLGFHGGELLARALAAFRLPGPAGRRIIRSLQGAGSADREEIGMVDEAGCQLLPLCGHGESSRQQPGPQAITHGPANDLVGGRIEQVGEAGPPLTGRQRRGLGEPGPVGNRSRDRLLQVAGCCRHAMTAANRPGTGCPATARMRHAARDDPHGSGAHYPGADGPRPTGRSCGP